MEESFSSGPDSLPAIYADKVRGQRTRSCTLEIPERENDAEILHTLLGIELKVGRHRFACPDLATARYMRVFARLGIREFAIPYDITQISTVADELETAWQRTLLKFETGFKATSDRQRSLGRSRVIKSIRSELTTIGPGSKMPEFKQSTKQRSS